MRILVVDDSRTMRKIVRKPGYRCPVPTLKKLAMSDMYFSFKGDPKRIPDDFPLEALSLKTTKLIAERFNGDRKVAEKSCAQEAVKFLGCRGWANWPAMEKEWFRRLSLTIALIPDLKDWNREEKKALVKIDEVLPFVFFHHLFLAERRT